MSDIVASSTTVNVHLRERGESAGPIDRPQPLVKWSPKDSQVLHFDEPWFFGISGVLIPGANVQFFGFTPRMAQELIKVLQKGLEEAGLEGGEEDGRKTSEDGEAGTTPIAD